jgi:hypothetical protein
VIAPGPRVDVHELELVVARIELVLQLDQPVVTDLPEEPNRRPFQFGHVERLDERARPPEVGGMLAPPPHRHAGHGVSGRDEGAVRVLLPSTPGDQLLDDDLAVIDDRGRPPEEPAQVLPRVRAPRLGSGGVEEVLLDRGLDDHRTSQVDLIEVGVVEGVPRPRRRDAEFLGQPVRLALVPGDPDAIPVRSRHPEEP